MSEPHHESDAAEKEEKIMLIVITDRGANVRAVMVESFHAAIGDLAVFCTRWLN